ncbi:MAG: 23S rRNA (pseudouridine(1915)-N(3))-methyltransferase RlmH [Gracilibacteraceae bacterium]|nr:23S rRNA (pseudouridine(1915)-N(3))-methyltransferase RlmH [Gracilibacteraceae bacterium]
MVCAGRIKEPYLADGLKEYEKRLSRFVRLETRETEDERCPETEAGEHRARETEGARLLRRLKAGEYVTALDPGGRMLDSPGLAGFMARRAQSGGSGLVFIVGGSLGLSAEVLERADFCLSLSLLTFPHQLTRLILLEQIYRACKINNHETYHK